MSGHPPQQDLLEGQKNRWEDDVKSDFVRMQLTNWKSCIKDRTKWKTFVEEAKTSLKL